ncbi:hypothetical protein [Listeria booriae]|uniref:hypothetical protein n=1 Tax=Listeria booriae TaxID=1552123 RepID=UPI0016256573|nr:hypothetical protein [Listeria booriae]MBC1983023.1 hypothetical protein [Listeria booriae]
MIIKTHSNANGTFFWDNIKKLTLFVARDQEPDFDFEENPETMIHVPVNLEVKVDAKAVADALVTRTVEQSAQQTDDKQIDDLSLLSVKQLRDIAKEKELDVPGNASKDVLVAAILANAETDNVNDDDDTGDDAQ